ncbi:MAG: Uncharacterised protein [Owenweeksia sp. TMED14]|nr:MAG: Uncharacterised protein [Owenweeksia sp. TMED14]
MDINGKTILESEYESSSHRTNIEVITQNIPNGEYLIELTVGNGVSVISKRLGIIH